MRILLGLLTLFAVFQAQAYCRLDGTPIDQDIQFEAESVPLDLATSNSYETKNMNFSFNRRLSFTCVPSSKTPNQFTLSASQDNNEYYLIENGTHKLYVRIWLEPENPAFLTFPGDSASRPSTALDSFKYRLNYSVQKNFSGKTYRTAELNGNIKLDSYLIVKPIACSIYDDCYSDFMDNTNHQYKYYINIRPTFTPTTCTFNEQEIDIPSISYQDLDKSDYFAPTTAQPELQCNSTLGVATSNISYHFEAISSPIGSILQNELGTEPGSAGDVGFLLMNHGQNITAYPSQKFNLARFGEDLQNVSSVPLDLKARYASYGNNIFSGRVQSKVKVVVDYD